MALPVNPVVQLANVANQKDSRWLTLEVCREFQRSKCSRSDQECKFAHPPPHVEVQNGRVTCCFDSIKGKCQRKDPPCKYLHPPQHLREQLLQNGRNNLIMKNLQMQALVAQASTGLQPIVPNMVPTLQSPYISSATSSYPYSAMTAGMQSVISSAENGALAQPQAAASPNSVTQATVPTQKMQRPDRLEVCREFQRGTCTRQPNECRYAHPPESVSVEQTDNTVTVCMDNVKGKCSRESCRYFHPPAHLQAQIKANQQRANSAAAVQAMQPVVEVLTTKKRPRDPADDLVLYGGIPQTAMGIHPSMFYNYKRPAMADAKSGLPMYQPTMMNYQTLAAMQMANQPQTYVPMTLTQIPTLHPVAATAGAATLVTNACSVVYLDDNNQLLDTLPVCRDFKAGQCTRPQCKYVHLVEEYVEITDGKVTVCRDGVKGKCLRPMCKYYHIPLILP